MKKVLLAFILVAALLTTIKAQQPQTKPDNKPPQTPTKAAPTVTQTAGNYIVPADVNVRLESDFRTFVVMAAINIAGFDYETAGEVLSPARAELRKDLVT